ncbi:alpha/beta fold hydrolase [Paenibacillus sp.]|uniref:thioesterase II family protein n=1 Tax=Paenibacillus sp. TaxID=58172 RepID=UPI0028ABEFAE|nr:alpha/beta fold hydrolase [Paenibacillus sp.]
MRIYSFPHAGGSATVYYKWKNYLSPNLELRPVELQGRGSLLGEFCFTNMDDMVADLYERIRRELHEGPFVLFGHSMGSLIAWELANYIKEKEGISPYHLFLSGMTPPHLRTRQEIPMHCLDRHAFKEKVASLGGMPIEMINDDSLFELFEPIIRADFQICDSYSFREPIEKMNCGITVFGGLDDEISSEELEEWRLYGDYFQLHMYQGGHFFIEQHCREVLNIINQTCNYLFYS